MARIGTMYGPDATFLGVPAADLADPASWAGAEVLIIGAPFDGGTSHRAGARFGPQAIRFTDYLPHDGARPHLALGVDPLAELRVADAGDVEMPSGDTETSLKRLEEAVHAACRGGAFPVVLGGDHTITLPDATGTARHVGWGRVSVIHFDAHADTGDSQFGSLYGHGTPMRRLIESGAVRGDRFLQIGLRGYWPGPETLAWMADRQMRSFEMSEVVARGLDDCLTEAFTIATSDCDGRLHGAAVAGRGPADRDGDAAGRHGRGRGGPALRPRRDHRVPGGPRGPRGAVRDRLAAAPRGGPARAPAGRPAPCQARSSAARAAPARAAPARASPGRIGRVTGIELKDQAGL
jgi:agmatinase